MEPIYTAKTKAAKNGQREFFFWYDPKRRQQVIKRLRQMKRADLIKKLYG
jgi:chorismate mutase